MAYIIQAAHTAGPVSADYVEDWGGRGPHVAIRAGDSSLYLPADEAHQLTVDILAALPKDGCGLPACTVNHGSLEEAGRG